jgi:ABC-type transport system involved in multi-copper enzyme maturation permease subunit
MTWVAWRQQRSIVGAFLLVAVILAAWMLITGLHEQSLWHQFLSTPCRGGKGVTTSNQVSCDNLQQSVYDSARYEPFAKVLGVILGPLFGLVLGVTAVASEFERGTTRLAWTQSESRTQWLASKFLVSIVSMTIVLVPLCLVFSWWVGASFMARMSPDVFPIAGLMGVAYAIFCFALVVAIGLFLRRAAWVFAIGLVLFAALFFTMQVQVHPNLVTPSVATLAPQQVTQGSTSGFYSNGGAPAGSWVLSNGYEPKGAKGVPSSSLESASTKDMYNCESPPASNQYSYCLKHLGLRNIETYVPDSQFWTMQFLEGGIYVLLAALLTALAFLGVRRTRV